MSRYGPVFPFGLTVEQGMKLFSKSDWHDCYKYMMHKNKRIKNTPNARRLAKIYKELTGEKFPGGIENAYIQRNYPGCYQRSAGFASWTLESISFAWLQDDNCPQQFASQHTARECIKDPEKYLDDYN